MEHTKLPLQFTGKTREFFGIWIVNVLLIVVTLGLYSPWAKVRSRRYFYGNTVLDNSAFDYTADPIAILKGYLIALLLLFIYSIAIQFFPAVQFIFILIFLGVMPWLVVRSMIFRAANSVYRNIRFTFGKNYRQAFTVFAGLPMLLPLTLGLIMPYIVFRQKQFLVNNSGFGTSPFSFHARPRDFYKVYAIILLFMLIPIIGIIAAIAIPAYHEYLATAAGKPFIKQAAGTPDMMTIILTQVLTISFTVLVSLFFYAYIGSRINNLIWNNIEIASNRFSSSLRARDLLWLYFSNLLAIVFSFGLLIPWAKIRMARYRMGKLTMLATTSLTGFVKQEQENVGAAGEEIGELFDIDIGL